MSQFITHIKEDLQKFKASDKMKFKLLFSLLNPRFIPMFLVRLSNLFYRYKIGILSKIFSLLNNILFGCDIGRGAEIDGGLYMPHPCGVVIGEYVKIGKNFIIHQGVTLGARGEEHELANPIIGNEVEIGTGAKILGGLKIGDYARVGANCVLLIDVPEKGVAVGIPGKVIATRKDV
ncbi:MAG: serine acetyltransferase [Candidatus Delongbacteria bacterium]|nr:serine acetyltransferase [Candidatus Delongbacteria bacterium]